MSKIVVKPLVWKPLYGSCGSVSAFTEDGKSKYFVMKLENDGGYRVYGIEGINDGGTEYNESLDRVKEIVYEDWTNTVLSYIKA